MYSEWNAGSLVEFVLAGHLKQPETAVFVCRRIFENYFTCVFESGLAHQNSPDLLSSAILWFSLCASTTVNGMHSSVSSVAYPNINPCGTSNHRLTPNILFSHIDKCESNTALDQHFLTGRERQLLPIDIAHLWDICSKCFFGQMWTLLCA